VAKECLVLWELFDTACHDGSFKNLSPSKKREMYGGGNQIASALSGHRGEMIDAMGR